MSLIVLNSKGSDPESFSNYVTSGIEFPANAEVCLVGSHINRKMMIEKEVEFSSSGNTLHFQYGHGGTAGAGRVYTPHRAYSYEFHNPAGVSPVRATGVAQITGTANAYLNNKNHTPISPLVGGWATAVEATTELFALKNTMKVPDRTESEGSTTMADVNFVPGATNKTSGGNNSTVTPSGSDGTKSIAYAGQPWIAVSSTSDRLSNFIDTRPLFNTDVGERIGTFAPLPSNTNIKGGGYHWQFPVVGIATNDALFNLRGGIIPSGGSIIDPSNNDSMNGTNSVLNKLSNNTEYCCWWQMERADAATGALTVGFYRKPISTNKGKQMDGAVKWGQIDFPASAGTVRIGMRPVKNPGLKYVIEAYGQTVTTATNIIVGATLLGTGGGFAGRVDITDPENPTTGGDFDLYNHLPIYQGVTVAEGDGGLRVAINAIHHGDSSENMSAVKQTDSLSYTFGFRPLTYQDQLVEKFDKNNYHGISKANIGYALGYSSSWLRQTALLMLPATEGAEAEVPISLTIPLAHSLVVQLPDLPISGFFGNSPGSFSAGTLGINSGGTSATIIGVIPFGEAPLREAISPGAGAPLAPSGIESRGQWYASPMENWIKLKNPSAFKVNSLRVKLTDELGQKPNICAGNTTVTIKIKAPAMGDVDRGLTIQG